MVIFHGKLLNNQMVRAKFQGYPWNMAPNSGGEAEVFVSGSFSLNLIPKIHMTVVHFENTLVISHSYGSHGNFVDVQAKNGSFSITSCITAKSPSKIPRFRPFGIHAHSTADFGSSKQPGGGKVLGETQAKQLGRSAFVKPSCEEPSGAWEYTIRSSFFFGSPIWSSEYE